MNWQNHIRSDPTVLVGKPVIRGTRLSVDFLLGLMAEGWTEKQLLENYPQLRRQTLQAMYAFAAECTRDEQVYVMDGKGERLKTHETGHLLRALKIQAMAEAVLGNRRRALSWLRKTRRAFGGANAMEMMRTETGGQLVEESLIQLDEGYFA